jgi:hypothetical protein
VITGPKPPLNSDTRNRRYLYVVPIPKAIDRLHLGAHIARCGITNCRKTESRSEGEKMQRHREEANAQPDVIFS